MIQLFTKKRNKKGFTLIELVVVIAILGVLAAIAVPKFTSVTESAQLRTFEANHRIVQSAITMYMAANNGAKPAADYAFSTEITGGISGLQDKPITGVTYTWNGTTLTSVGTSIKAGTANLTFTP